MEIATFGLLAYVLIAGVVMLDSIVPAVPSEVLIVAAAAASATGSLSVLGVAAAGAAGAFAGDVILHTMGRRTRGRWANRFERNRRWSSAMKLVHDANVGVVVLGRFVPLGRTAVAFVSGTSGLSWRRYLPAAACGAGLWAIVMTALGRAGSGLTGSIFVTLAAGALVTAGIGIGAGVAMRRRRILASAG